ncbi:hypothetical protein Mal15_60750 [Stieleria maiorica]|uniref:Uncharacterized protein n=1 Tax=Stieleria maiorica TaxID=2795974 RepID=A0A5B9MKY9_9BACT|nr:hypothetical protein Mal15_60750 [Stieleria maiorica]
MISSAKHRQKKNDRNLIYDNCHILYDTCHKVKREAEIFAREVGRASRIVDRRNKRRAPASGKRQRAAREPAPSSFPGSCLGTHFRRGSCLAGTEGGAFLQSRSKAEPWNEKYEPEAQANAPSFPGSCLGTHLRRGSSLAGTEGGAFRQSRSKAEPWNEKYEPESQANAPSFPGSCLGTHLRRGSSLAGTEGGAFRQLPFQGGALEREVRARIASECPLVPGLLPGNAPPERLQPRGNRRRSLPPTPVPRRSPGTRSTSPKRKRMPPRSRAPAWERTSGEAPASREPKAEPSANPRSKAEPWNEKYEPEAQANAPSFPGSCLGTHLRRGSSLAGTEGGAFRQFPFQGGALEREVRARSASECPLVPRLLPGNAPPARLQPRRNRKRSLPPIPFQGGALEREVGPRAARYPSATLTLRSERPVGCDGHCTRRPADWKPAPPVGRHQVRRCCRD